MRGTLGAGAAATAGLSTRPTTTTYIPPTTTTTAGTLAERLAALRSTPTTTTTRTTSSTGGTLAERLAALRTPTTTGTTTRTTTGTTTTPRTTTGTTTGTTTTPRTTTVTRTTPPVNTGPSGGEDVPFGTQIAPAGRRGGLPTYAAQIPDELQGMLKERMQQAKMTQSTLQTRLQQVLNEAKVQGRPMTPKQAIEEATTTQYVPGTGTRDQISSYERWRNQQGAAPEGTIREFRLPNTNQVAYVMAQRGDMQGRSANELMWVPVTNPVTGGLPTESDREFMANYIRLQRTMMDQPSYEERVRINDQLTEQRNAYLRQQQGR